MQSIVSAIQFQPTLLDVKANIVKAQMLTHEAAIKGARIIVLPELALSGFTLRNSREAFDACQDRHGYQTEAFTPIAQRFNCHVVLGYVELCDGKLYNSAVTIGPNGVVANSQKHNLYGNDNIWATPSEIMPSVAMTPQGRLGVLICRDISNNYRESYKFYQPEHKFYHKGSVDVVALLTNWGNGYSYPDSSWVELAESLNTNVIVSNRVGKERDLVYKGGSVIITRERKLWTNGSNFDGDCVVGGVIE